MTDAPHIHLHTSNRSENVAVVRDLLEGLATALGLRRELTDDIKTAVSEACNNVVLHAYAGNDGPMELDVTVAPRELQLVIRDHGLGIRPHVEGVDGHLRGVGLAVIQTFANRVQLRGRLEQGTEVEMSFTLPPDRGGVLDRLGATPAAAVTRGGEVVMALLDAELLRAILPRVTAAMAVRAHFTVDRLSDAQLVADAVAAHAAAIRLAGSIIVELTSASRELELRLGPLPAGAGHKLLAGTPGEPPHLLEQLCDDVAIELDAATGEADGAEHVRVRISDRSIRPSPAAGESRAPLDDRRG